VEAERAFRQAEALEPSSGRAHIMLGLLYTDIKRNREALRELQTGLKSEPTNPQALEALRKLQSQDSSSRSDLQAPKADQ
jgi:predicted Zn-dependent protease